MDYAFLLCYRTVTCVCCLLKALFSGLRSHCTNVDWENSELAFSYCFCIWWMCRLWKSSLPFQWIFKSHLFIMMCLSFQPFCFPRCQYNQNRIVPVSSVSACQHTAISRTCLFIRSSWCCGPGLLFFWHLFLPQPKNTIRNFIPERSLLPDCNSHIFGHKFTWPAFNKTLEFEVINPFAFE